MEENKTKNEELRCPHCQLVISNLKKVSLKKMYKCTNCEGKYFLEKEPVIYFVSTPYITSKP